MMKLVPVLFALLGTALASECFPQCKFTFCNLINQYEVGLPNRAFTDQICLNGVKIGVDATSGEPLIGTLPAKLISGAALKGLTKPFSKTFIKTVSRGQGSALAHETPKGNQASFLEDLCVKVPISSYTIRENEKVVSKVSENEETDCIAVITELPTMIPIQPPTSPAV